MRTSVSSDAVNNVLVQEVPEITHMHYPQSFRLYDERMAVISMIMGDKHYVGVVSYRGMADGAARSARLVRIDNDSHAVLASHSKCRMSVPFYFHG